MFLRNNRSIASFVRFGFLPAFFVLIISITPNLFIQSNALAEDPSMAISSNGYIELEARAGTFQSATFNISVSDDKNVIFGSSFDTNGEPWRFFKGTLANMTIKLEE